MGAIDMNMDEIETMLAPGGKVEVADAVEHADTISIMLMSFPHMFPPPPTSGGRMSIAMRQPIRSHRPKCGRIFSDFYQRARAASKLAFDASRAKHGNEFRELIGQLRAACNSCHATYMKTE